ncbi:MAG: DUF1285 domain-containing protein [Granulosicoccus sp.]
MSQKPLSLDRIADAIAAHALPPVHDWQPDSTRVVDIRIARNGDWFYQGSRIDRIRMVKLFSTVLRVDDDNHTYLVTPQERLRITVEDAPFTAVLVEQHGGPSDTTLVFTTNVDEKIIADADHPISVAYAEVGGEPSPYVLVRDRLQALISRSAFYQLADWAVIREGIAGVESSGVFMPLSESEQSHE